MIGKLLRQLFPALGRYIGYHVMRMAGGRKPAEVSLDSGLASPSPSPLLDVDALAHDIGLDPAYERLTQWPTYRENVPTADLRANSLFQLWSTTSHGHKWPQYFEAYESIFGPRRNDPMRILEIGVLEGSSLRLWKRYFSHPGTLIVGIDINPACIKSDAPEDGIRVRIGSQADAVFLARVVEEFGPFDLIIDDGSHRSSHIITSFNHLYLAGLKTSGIYFVEDLHANYWPGWRDSQRSFLDVCKELMEHMHAHYRSAPPEAFLVDRPSDQPMAALAVPLITTLIKEIRILDSIVAIYKTDRRYIPHYLQSELQE